MPPPPDELGGHLDDLFPLLREVARRYLDQWPSGHTLDSVALVSEVYLRLSGDDRVRWNDETHFKAMFARVMRHTLVDHARKKRAAKRGGDLVRVATYDINQFPDELGHDQLIALDDALQELEHIDLEAMQIIEYRFFGGGTLKEAAQALGMPYIRARRRWAYARVWLREKLT
ncbi:MAG: ECF-type sigma factor [Bacteroidota bacterium]